MYQLEVKRVLVEYLFSPNEGWEVTVDVDAAERGYDGKHPLGKRDTVGAAENWLRENGVRIGPHHEFGRADIVASKQGKPLYVVEVEGESTKQKEQAMYSALGQTILMMREAAGIKHALAVPDTPEWERQLRKIPMHVRTMLNFDVWLVSFSEVRPIEGER